MRHSTVPGGMAILVCILAVLAAACTSAVPPMKETPGTPAEPAATSAGNQVQGPGVPPDAAVAACSGKATGDSCRFADRDGTAAGTCDERPGILACAPDKPGNNSTRSEMPAGPSPSAAVPGVTPGITGARSAAGSTFTLTSGAGPDGGTMPDEYSCDGAGASPALSWTGAPAGTTEFALMMTTVPVDGSTRWNWVLYHIPGTATGIARNGSAIGVLGTGSHGTVMQYDPPCSQGPGAKRYTFTLYALSASPELPANPPEVTGPVLTSAISGITLGTASLDLNHARAGQS